MIIYSSALICALLTHNINECSTMDKIGINVELSKAEIAKTDKDLDLIAIVSINNKSTKDVYINYNVAIDQFLNFSILDTENKILAKFSVATVYSSVSNQYVSETIASGKSLVMKRCFADVLTDVRGKPGKYKLIIQYHVNDKLSLSSSSDITIK